jgi:molybdate transport system substrate-binding protein
MNGKLFILTTLLFIFLSSNSYAKKTLSIFVGAASKPATEKAVELFEKKTGINVDVSFGGSG